MLLTREQHSMPRGLDAFLGTARLISLYIRMDV